MQCLSGANSVEGVATVYFQTFTFLGGYGTHFELAE